jgi:hypothetical protein
MSISHMFWQRNMTGLPAASTLCSDGMTLRSMCAP